jgi:quercetin dioxygenase-like cupin family protein
MKDRNLEKLFGVTYFPKNERIIKKSVSEDAYSYALYLGKHDIVIEAGDTAWMIKKNNVAYTVPGPKKIKSDLLTTVIRGYKTDTKTCELTLSSILPYVNGCSTKQIFPPDRHGDPTLQLLRIPPHTREQAHHIHSTVRIVYVLDGSGYSIVGTKDKHVREKLTKGMVIVLEKMSPHHFETEGDWLTVVPLHVFSALPKGIENDHPMFNGTFLVGNF